MRLSIAYIAPYDQTTSWGPEAVTGTHRFLQRIWKLTSDFLEISSITKTSIPNNPCHQTIMEAVHRTIKKVGQDIDNMYFNTAIAAQMELVNKLYKIKVDDNFQSLTAWKFALSSMLQLLAPFAPHISEELWQSLGNKSSIHLSLWPQYDETFLAQDTMTIVVQINGKLRNQIELPVEFNEKKVVAAVTSDIKVASFLKGRTLKKYIYVPQKLINLVV